MQGRPEEPPEQTDTTRSGTPEGAHMTQTHPGVMPSLEPAADEDPDLGTQLASFLDRHNEELVAFRRDLHMHPELGFTEFRTTARVVERLKEAGLQPRVLPKGTGVICDIGPENGPTVALRADIDALPLPDEKEVAYASTIPGLSHACGHDVHTAVVLGAGLFLARQAALGLLPGRVRLLFQPA